MERFEGQREDEKIVFVFRRHILAMRRGFYGLLIPFAVGSLPYLLIPDNLDLLWLAGGGFLLGSVLFFHHWIGWYYSIFIITNQRIQQTSQTGVFGKTVIDLSLSKIQNISYNIPGLTGELFGFGTIVIQTYVGDLVIDKVGKPEKIYNKLQETVHKSIPSVGIENDEIATT